MWAPRGSNFITNDVNIWLALTARASHINTCTHTQIQSSLQEINCNTTVLHLFVTHNILSHHTKTSAGVLRFRGKDVMYRIICYSLEAFKV